MKIEARRIAGIQTPGILDWIIGVIVVLTSLGMFEGGGGLP